MTTAKLNETTLRASAGVHNIALGEEETPESIAGKLKTHFATFSDDDLSTCKCGMDSSPVLDPVCPFCGEGDDEPAKVPVSPNQSATEAPSMNTATTTNSKPTNAKPTTAAKPDKLANVKPKTSALPKTSIVKGAASAPREMVSATKLDEAVKHVSELKANAAVGFWQLGHYIRTEIFEKELWKLRQTEDGKVAYTGFNAFALQELNMTSANAYKLMDVSKEFTEAQVKTFGPTKLGLVLQAPEEERERILKEAGGKSTSQVKKEVKKAKTKHNVTGKRETGRKKTPSGGGRKAAKTLTVATMLERRRVELWTKATIGAKDAKDRKRAKKISDEPTGTYELSNGVTIKVTLQANPAGELVLIVEGKEPKE